MTAHVVAYIVASAVAYAFASTFAYEVNNADAAVAYHSCPEPLLRLKKVQAI